jgi:lysophospholipase L1-like esterase
VKRLAVAALLLLVAGCGAGNPWPSVPTAPLGGASHTVLLLGDSLLNQTAATLSSSLSWHGLDANVVDETYGGTGLLDPRMVATQIAIVDAHPHADIVVIEFSGNCFNCTVAYGSADFVKQWMANLRAITSYAESRDKHVVLVVSPPIRPDLAWAVGQKQLGSETARLALTDHLALANWSDALSDSNGNYQQVLFYADFFADATTHTVRNDDGVHLTEDGARRAADWTVQAMRPFWTGRS